MMYKAQIKLEKANPERFMQAFKEGINRMKLTSNKQNANEDKWDIAPEANV